MYPMNVLEDVHFSVVALKLPSALDIAEEPTGLALQSPSHHQ